MSNVYELLWSLGHKLGEHFVRTLVWYIKREDITLQTEDKAGDITQYTWFSKN